MDNNLDITQEDLGLSEDLPVLENHIENNQAESSISDTTDNAVYGDLTDSNLASTSISNISESEVNASLSQNLDDSMAETNKDEKLDLSLSEMSFDTTKELSELSELSQPSTLTQESSLNVKEHEELLQESNAEEAILMEDPVEKIVSELDETLTPITQGDNEEMDATVEDSVGAKEPEIENKLPEVTEDVVMDCDEVKNAESNLNKESDSVQEEAAEISEEKDVEELVGDNLKEIIETIDSAVKDKKGTEELNKEVENVEELAEDKLEDDEIVKTTDKLEDDKDKSNTDEADKSQEASGSSDEKQRDKDLEETQVNNDKEIALVEQITTTENHFDESDNEERNIESIECEGDKTVDESAANIEDQLKEQEDNPTVFVQVNSETEKDGDDKDDSDNNKGDFLEQDPIAADGFDHLNEDREGADEELCIIPDTERVISQAEKDAAVAIPPLRDISEASTSAEDSTSQELSAQSSTTSPVVIHKNEKDDLQYCCLPQCLLQRKSKYCYTKPDGELAYICDDVCLDFFKNAQTEKVALSWEEGNLRVKNFTGAARKDSSTPVSFTRKCAACKKLTNDIENNLTWEIMDFCNEFCLTRYQKEIGSHCSSCSGEVRANSLGKYCVRFGNDIRQFCTSHCLEEYKKGLKVCSYCQQDMSGGPEGFLAPVGDKGQFKDFCSQLCMEKYDIMTNDRPLKVSADTKCSVCKADKAIAIDFELDGTNNYFCGEPCFVAFSFVNNITPGKCAMCRRNFSKKVLEKNTMFYDNAQHSFCSNSCQNIYIIAHRKIVPCSWCKVKKYNFDMIRRYSKTGNQINMCSVNCLNLYHVSLNAVSAKKQPCHLCNKNLSSMYHLTMSDATIRNFCSYTCVMTFQGQFNKQPISLSAENEPVPTGAPRKIKKITKTDENGPNSEIPTMPVITNVQSLANTNGGLVPTPGLTPITTRSTRSKSNNSAPSQVLNTLTEFPVQIQVKQHFIVRPAPIPDQRNVGTMCSVRKANKGTNIKPVMVNKECQTDKREADKILIPVPVPIYVPTPMHMFTAPVPIPVPFPIPIPIPIFIPTTRNSATGIMKEIKKIQVKIPTDPYEAELLMMAEMVAEEKKEENTDSESDVDEAPGAEETTFSPEPVDASNTFGDDMLQMALKMATELDEPAVDLEGALTASTITAPQGGEPVTEESVDDPQPMHHLIDRPSLRGRKRGMRQSRGTGAKRGRRLSHQVDMPLMGATAPPAPPPEPTEKPDANMCLKYTFGVNAWKQWVTTKNTELEKSSRRVKLFKTEILQLTADELNYSLCLFVKEVRKPNGAEYAPDTIYYLCLGIQQFLFENGRIDNIFCDPYYEKFTDCLDEVAKKFSVLYNDSHYIVTRVEEEHLWESKQLGAHSPHVLLSTLMFFNTKHFNLTSVDEHMQLSFSHIMKHWKRNPNQPGASKVPGSRNVLLRFYPPQSAIQNNARKKKVYEQQENEENPLRCPVKLYEFYLSKCPESVKTRNDVFYLQPERSCVPDSPVWYSTMPLPRDALEKMLHRVKMVKEINVALLTS